MKSLLISRNTIQRKVEYLGDKISKDYLEKDLVIICVLKGSYLFFSDLVRQIKIKTEPKIDFIQLSSYGSSTESSGEIKLKKDIEIDIEGKDVLIVEDIVETGLTMEFLTKYLYDKKCKHVKICTLLQKPLKMKSDVFIDYVGFMIGEEFVIGYGLDFDEKYRTLPEIFLLKNPS